MPCAFPVVLPVAGSIRHLTRGQSAVLYICAPPGQALRCFVFQLSEHLGGLSYLPPTDLIPHITPLGVRSCFCFCIFPCAIGTGFGISQHRSSLIRCKTSEDHHEVPRSHRMAGVGKSHMVTLWFWTNILSVHRLKVQQIGGFPVLDQGHVAKSREVLNLYAL